MSANYLLFLAIGRLLIFLGAKFIENNKIKMDFLNRLASCVLCSGVWVYTLLSFVSGYIVLDDWTNIFILSQVVTGCFSAYLMYLLENGWKSTHEVIIV